MDKTALGMRIREARKKKGLTQEKLAEIVDTSILYVSEIERGKKMPSLNTFIRMIEALDISADYVLRYEITTGRDHVYDEMSRKLEGLTPKQRKGAMDILDAYIANL